MASWTERNVVNRAVRVGVRLGRDIDGVRELEVRGRRTGKPRRTPLKVLHVDGECYLVSLSGESGWVRNLRAQPSARLRFRNRVEDVVAIELADGEKRPVVRAYFEAAGRAETRDRLAGTAGEPVPVFRLAAPR